MRPLCHACWVEAGEQEYEPTPSPSNDWEFVEISKYNDLKAKHERVLQMLEIAKTKLREIRWSWENDAGRQCDNLAYEGLSEIESLK